MNWDNLDWDNFSCVDMTRRIKDKIDKELENMSVVEYLRRKKEAREAVANHAAT